MENQTTCQICGRAIRSKNGRIAHHGYTRPYQMGFQTSSCFGARHAPYEQGHDAIDLYIPMLIDWLNRTNVALKDWRDSPPAQIKFQPVDGWHHPVGQPRMLDRPEGFDSVKNLEHGSYSFRTYPCEHANRFRQLKQEIKSIEADQKYMADRRAAWVAPVMEVA